MKNDIDAQFLCKDCDRYNQCRYYHNRKEDSYICKYFELNLAIPDKESCEDAVSRQAVIKELNEHAYSKEYCVEHGIDWSIDLGMANIVAKSLPSVTHIRPKGEWKYDKTIQNWRCSKCHETPKTLGYVGTKEFMAEHFKFCNHCGADMRGEK